MSEKTLLWRLNLMGEANLYTPAGEAVKFPSAKQISLLAALTLQPGEQLLRSDLASSLWPRVQAKAGRDSLRTALSHLKTRLPESAIATSSQSVLLKADWLTCDAWEAVTVDNPKIAEDFMPGYCEEWIIDERLRRRSMASARLADAIDSAYSSDQFEEALRLAELAGKADPLNESIAQRRIAILERTGQLSQAILVAKSFRTASIRELGTLPTVATSSTSPLDCSPLVSAARWLINRNPQEALAMLAATPTEWLYASSAMALEIHDQVLAASQSESPARRLVEAQRYQLLVQAGRLRDAAGIGEPMLEKVVDIEEWAAAARVACASSYFYLSTGQFKKSRNAAHMAVAFSTKTKSLPAEIEYRQELATILIQLCEFDSAQSEFTKCDPLLDQVDSVALLASQAMGQLEFNLRKNRIDHASHSIDLSRRLHEQGGHSRMKPWVHFAYSTVHLSVGDAPSALRELEVVKAIGEETGGQAVTGIANDWLAKAYFALGEFDLAAEALNEADSYRESRGSVRSPNEIAKIARVKEKVMSKKVAFGASR